VTNNKNITSGRYSFNYSGPKKGSERATFNRAIRRITRTTLRNHSEG